MQQLLRLLRTLWYIPAPALLWRLWARLKVRYYQSPFYNLRSVVAAEVNTPLTYTGIEVLAGNAQRGQALATGNWQLAGQVFPLGAPPQTWLPPKLQPLQTFELHYHEWLADLRAANNPKLARSLLADWLLNFGHYHPVVWHPYPLSLRLVAWLTHGRWLLAEANDEFKAAFEACLRQQLAHLRHNCEWDLGGNHLIKNLKALLLGGLAIHDGTLTLWAESQLLRALQHQVLPDGAHDERSPHYHAQVLQDVLETRAALRNAGAGGAGVWDDVATRMGAALAFYTYPDGALGLWNDGQLGEAARLAQLVAASGGAHAAAQLPNAGYYKFAQGNLGAMLDAGLVGPNENPGHAHADMLALELWHGPHRVVVNGGTLAYQHKLRGYFRSTAAHSTLAIEGENSAEVWAEHRVGRRPHVVSFTPNLQSLGGVASHDGYRHLGLAHTRKLTLSAFTLTGEDTLSGPAHTNRAWVRFHLHPTVKVRQTTETEAELTLPNGVKASFTCTGGRLTLQASRYAPQFNQLAESQQLAVRLQGANLVWAFKFSA